MPDVGAIVLSTAGAAATASENKLGLHALAKQGLDEELQSTRTSGKRTQAELDRSESRTVGEFLDKMTRQVMALPVSERAPALEKALKSIDPGLNEAVLREAKILISRGNNPARSLRAAVGGALVARRRRHYWTLQNETVPAQAKLVSEGIFTATADPKERARRIKKAIDSLLPRERPKYDAKQARIRLKEVGLGKKQIERVMRAPRLTSAMIAAGIASDLKKGKPQAEALHRGVERAMRAFMWDSIKANGVARGVEFCVFASIIAAGLALVGTIVGAAVPAAQAARARKEARRAEDRQRAAPLSTGEIEQLVTTLIPSNPAWGPQSRQSSLDYIRLMRNGRVTFVDPEERMIQERFTQVRAAIDAAARAAQNKKIMIGAGVGVAALIGLGVIVKSRRKAKK